MLGAYILIQAEIGAAASIADQVAAVPGVLAAVGVTGPYDVIVRAEAENAEELGDLVVARIQRIEGITTPSPVRSCGTCKRERTERRHGEQLGHHRVDDHRVY